MEVEAGAEVVFAGVGTRWADAAAGNGREGADEKGEGGDAGSRVAVGVAGRLATSAGANSMEELASSAGCLAREGGRPFVLGLFASPALRSAASSAACLGVEVGEASVCGASESPGTTGADDEGVEDDDATGAVGEEVGRGTTVGNAVTFVRGGVCPVVGVFMEAAA